MPTISRVHYTSAKLSDDRHPIYLRLTHKRKPHYLPIYRNDSRFTCKKEQWDKSKKLLQANKKLNPEYKTINDAIEQRENRLRNIIQNHINNLIPWSIDKIKGEFYNTIEHTDVISFINHTKTKSNKSEANFLSDLKRDLLEFNDNKVLYFNEVDYECTQEFIRFLQYKNCNNTSIGIRLRYLRKVLNLAIKQNIGSTLTYPFSSKYGATKFVKIQQYENNERKLAIDVNVIDQIKNTIFKTHEDEIARRLFISSYAGRGMNFRDMATLSQKHIYKVGNDNYINYSRGKTGSNFNFKISPLLQEQIDWFNENSLLIGDALFPIIQDKKINDLYKYLHNKLNSFNQRLKKIAKLLNVAKSNMRLSSYAARHSYATNLYRNNFPINKISKTLGHKNIKTTYHYLKSFTEDEISADIEAIIG